MSVIVNKSLSSPADVMGDPAENNILLEQSKGLVFSIDSLILFVCPLMF